jgi:hypothetical protein
LLLSATAVLSPHERARAQGGRHGIEASIDLDAMIDAAADAERIVGRELPSQVVRAGPRTRLAAN